MSLIRFRKYYKEISSLSFEVNMLTSHTVFFDFHGHVNQISIAIYFDGWTDMKERYYKNEVYFREKDLNQEALKEMVTVLKKLLK